MAAHNPQYQMGENGPLRPAIRKRLEDAKDKLNLTLAQAGARLGFSGPFMSALLKDSDPARVRTKHINRIVQALEDMEVEAGIKTAPAAPTPSQQANQAGVNSTDALEQLKALGVAARKLGFEATFKLL